MKQSFSFGETVFTGQPKDGFSTELMSKSVSKETSRNRAKGRKEPANKPAVYQTKGRHDDRSQNWEEKIDDEKANSRSPGPVSG